MQDLLEGDFVMDVTLCVKSATSSSDIPLSTTDLAHEVHKASVAVLAFPLLNLLLHFCHISRQGNRLAIMVVHEIVRLAFNELVPILDFLV